MTHRATMVARVRVDPRRHRTLSARRDGIDREPGEERTAPTAWKQRNPGVLECGFTGPFRNPIGSKSLIDEERIFTPLVGGSVPTRPPLPEVHHRNARGGAAECVVLAGWSRRRPSTSSGGGWTAAMTARRPRASSDGDRTVYAVLTALKKEQRHLEPGLEIQPGRTIFAPGWEGPSLDQQCRGDSQ